MLLGSQLIIRNQGALLSHYYNRRKPFYFSLFFSPEIRAASEKLSELKDQRSSSGSNTPTFRSATPLKMPDGNDEALDAQKKRFEELKVRN